MKTSNVKRRLRVAIGLLERGYTQKRIAEEFGVTSACISEMLISHRCSVKNFLKEYPFISKKRIV